MNVLTKLYEKLFVPKDVRKLCQALRDGKLHIIGYNYSKRYDCDALDKYASVQLAHSENCNDWIKVWYDDDVTVYKNHSESVTANLKGYSRLVDLAYAAHRAKQKAARLTEAEKARVVVQGHINEIFADILKD